MEGVVDVPELSSASGFATAASVAALTSSTVGVLDQRSKTLVGLVVTDRDNEATARDVEAMLSSSSSQSSGGGFFSSAIFFR